ncbi:ExbD/TolR family protein [Aliikangiella maris]|uniref:Biopolymer transporter ExbD n=2 Tax=Aliikangiella maris TaxID=3162458 RepID=A0ABV3MSI1_9GAMM
MRRKMTTESADSPDMTPMLDIVFIMLIFFIVTTTFTNVSGIDMNKSTNQESNQKDNRALVVSIDAAENINFLGRIVDVNALRANVESEIAKSKKAISFIVKTHEVASTDVLIKAVDQIKRAGVTQVQVAKL